MPLLPVYTCMDLSMHGVTITSYFSVSADNLQSFSVDPQAAAAFADSDTALAALNDVDWENNPALATSLMSSVGNSTQVGVCFTSDVRKTKSILT